MEIEQRSVLALVGLLFEARVAAGPGVIVFCRKAGRDITASLAGAVKNGCQGIISFGVAGGLSPDLRPGDWIVASMVVSVEGSYTANLMLSRKLLEAVPGAEYAPIAGVDAPVLDPASKREFHRLVGASAVDMESHLVARFATARGLAFAAIRVVIDPAHRTVPAAALIGLRPDGGADAKAVLRALLRNPRQLPSVARLAADALTAGTALVKIRRLLGPGLGLLGANQPESLGSRQ